MDFNGVNVFGNTSLADLFKQIHKNNKDIDKQITSLIEVVTPLASQNAGSAVMLMPTVKDLLDVNVKNNDQLVKMAAIVQRAATVNGSSQEPLIDMNEIQSLLDEQQAIKEDGQKLLESVPQVPQLEKK